jgi:hypothetical protein
MMNDQIISDSTGQPFNVGDAVSLPMPKSNEYGGTIGMVAGQVYSDPFDSKLVCLVNVLGDVGPTVVFAVSDLHPLTTTTAIAELTGQWGYRDITDLVRRVNEQEDLDFDYLCVLQEPDGSPVYCRRARRLFKELSAARAEGHRYEECPVPDPEKNLWMIIGNFDDEDDDQ